MFLAQLAILCMSVAGRAFAPRGLLAGTAMAVSYGALASRTVPPERSCVIRCGRCGGEYSGCASHIPGACSSCDQMAEREKKRVEDAKKYLRRKLDVVEKKLILNKSVIADKERFLRERRIKQNTLATKLDSVRSEISEIEGHIGNARMELNSTTKKVNALGSRIRGIDGRLYRANVEKKDASDLEAEKNRMESELVTEVNRKINERSLLKEMEKKKTKKENEMRETERMIGNLWSLITNNESDIRMMNQDGVTLGEERREFDAGAAESPLVAFSGRRLSLVLVFWIGASLSARETSF